MSPARKPVTTDARAPHRGNSRRASRVNSPAESATSAATLWDLAPFMRDELNPAAEEALTLLRRTCWPPLYAFLRRKGHEPENAEDLVQEFLERLPVERFPSDSGPQKGRFRALLLVALRLHLAKFRDGHAAPRHRRSQIHVALEEPGVQARCEAAVASGLDAELVFDRVWAETILEAAATELRREFEQSGRLALFEVLRVWLAVDAAPGDYAAAAAHAGLSEGALAVAVHRLRLRLRRLIRAQVARTVRAPASVDDELRHLIDVLMRSRAQPVALRPDTPGSRLPG